MKRFLLMVLLLAGAVWIGIRWFAPSSGSQELSLPVHSITTLTMDTAMGNVKVIGIEDAEEITAKVDLKHKWFGPRAAIEFSLKQEGERAVLVLDRNRRFSWFDFAPSTELTVLVPSHLMVRVDDGSGNLHIEHIYGGLDVIDGSGNLTVRNVGGGVSIEDGSGNMTVRNVDGDLWIEDGSGNMDVRQVSGSVTVNDGSGNVNISQVDGDVVIEDDGSGRLNISGVKGNVVNQK